MEIIAYNISQTYLSLGDKSALFTHLQYFWTDQFIGIYLHGDDYLILIFIILLDLHTWNVFIFTGYRLVVIR